MERNQSRGNSLFWCDGGEWPSLAECSVSSTNEVTVKINMKREGGRERWREGVGPGTTRWIDKRAPCLPWQVQFKTPTAQPTTTNRQADLYHNADHHYILLRWSSFWLAVAPLCTTSEGISLIRKKKKKTGKPFNAAVAARGTVKMKRPRRAHTRSTHNGLWKYLTKHSLKIHNPLWWSPLHQHQSLTGPSDCVTTQ